jgi:hypothetical protein
VFGFQREMARFLVLVADDLVNVPAQVADGIAFNAFLAFLPHIGKDSSVTPLGIESYVDTVK